MAAGYGSFRFEHGNPVPKVVEKVRGLPMVAHALKAAERAGIKDTFVVVNPRDRDLVRAGLAFAERIGAIEKMPTFVVQQKRLGSADAVYRALPALGRAGATRVLIAYGDMPCWSTDTIRRLMAQDCDDHVVTMTVATRSSAYPVLDTYGRVVKSATGKIERVVEMRDPEATPAIQALPSVNPSLWIWETAWLARAIELITPFKKDDGYGDERYTPRLIAIAAQQKRIIAEMPLGASAGGEAVGVNTMDELIALNHVPLFSSAC